MVITRAGQCAYLINNITSKLCCNTCVMHTDPWVMHKDPWVMHTDPWVMHTDPWVMHTDPWVMHTDPWVMHTDPWVRVMIEPTAYYPCICRLKI